MFKVEATLQTLTFKYFERDTRLHQSIAFTTKTKVKSDERSICMVLPILLSALILSFDSVGKATLMVVEDFLDFRRFPSQASRHMT